MLMRVVEDFFSEVGGQRRTVGVEEAVETSGKHWVVGKRGYQRRVEVGGGVVDVGIERADERRCDGAERQRGVGGVEFLRIDVGGLQLRLTEDGNQQVEVSAGIELPALQIALGVTYGQHLGGPGQRDVEQVLFAGVVLFDVGGSREIGTVDQNAFAIVEHHVVAGGFGEGGFVEAQNECSADAGMTRSVDRRDEHLIEARRHDADVELAEGLFEGL